MDTHQTNDPGENLLDLPLERSSADELDQDDDWSAPIFGGLEPASHGELDLHGFPHHQEGETGLFSAFDGAPSVHADSSAPLIDGLLELTDDVWGPDRGETADLLPGPALEEWVDGPAVEPVPADEHAEALFALPAPFEQPSVRQTARRGARDVWAGMAPNRRLAIGIAGSAFAAVALVGAVWVQRPNLSEDVISTGTVQTTTSVAARRSPPAPTAPPATDSSLAPAPDTSLAPATNDPVGPASPVPAVSGGPASPRTAAAGAAPSAPSAPVTTAPARVSPAPATAAVETTEPPATTVPPDTTAPPATPDTTETTRRSREPPTTVVTEPPTPTTVAPTESSDAVPCSEFITKGRLACPPVE